MWIKLMGANFSTSNIGSLKSYAIDTTGLIGLTVSPTSISYETEGESKTQELTFTIKTGYKLAANSIITITDVDGVSLGTASADTDITAGGTIKTTITTTKNIIVTGTAEVVEDESDDSGSSTYTFTVNPTPSTATVTLSATGYSSVSGTGAQSISVAVNTVVSYQVSADGYSSVSNSQTVTENKTIEVSLVALGDEGIITWTNEAYQSGTGFATNTKRACAKMACEPGDIITIYGLDDYTTIDFVGLTSDGTIIGTASSSNSNLYLTNEDGVVSFYVNKSISAFSTAAYICVTFKNSTETTIDTSTLPTTYERRQLIFTNARFDTSSSAFVSDQTRLSTDYLTIGSNKTVTITNIPEGYEDLTYVDFVAYDADKTYITYTSSGATIAIDDNNTITITLPTTSKFLTGTYVRFSMKVSSASSTAISPIVFRNCTITSA